MTKILLFIIILFSFGCSSKPIYHYNVLSTKGFVKYKYKDDFEAFFCQEIYNIMNEKYPPAKYKFYYLLDFENDKMFALTTNKLRKKGYYLHSLQNMDETSSNEKFFYYVVDMLDYNIYYLKIHINNKELTRTYKTQHKNYTTSLIPVTGWIESGD